MTFPSKKEITQIDCTLHKSFGRLWGESQSNEWTIYHAKIRPITHKGMSLINTPLVISSRIFLLQSQDIPIYYLFRLAFQAKIKTKVSYRDKAPRSAMFQILCEFWGCANLHIQ
jgi:hypothetical protein